MSDTKSDNDDLSLTHEYIIAGIVILLFGLLYWFLNGGWNSNSENTSSYPPIALSGNTVADSAKKELSLGGAVGTGVVAASTVAATSAVQASTHIEPTNTDVAKVAETPAVDDINKNNKEAVVVEPTVDLATKNQVADANVKKEDVVKNVAVAPVVEKADVVPPEVAPVVAENATKADLKAQSQPALPSSYTLPDGTPVKLASDGFEGDLQHVFAKNEINKALIFDQIYFDTGSEKIKAKSEQQIRATAAVMNAYPKTSILLQGHTDSKGAAKKNIELSLMRANSMGLALGALGIDTERVRILGMGDAFPIKSNDTEEGRKKNRRIEILLQQ